MKKINKMTKWIDTTNFEMCKYVYSSIANIGGFPIIDIEARSNRRLVRGRIKEFKNIQGELSTNEILMKRLYGAWRQKKLRRSDKMCGIKEYSFKLDVYVNNELDFIAKTAKKSRNEAIELMINAYHVLISSKLARGQQEAWWNELTDNIPEEYRLKDELKEANGIIEELQKENDALTYQLNKLRIKSNTDANIDDASDEIEQKQPAKKYISLKNTPRELNSQGIPIIRLSTRTRSKKPKP